jgi:catalase
VEESLAERVAVGLAMALPTKAKAAKEPVSMKPSDALSIQKSAKKTLVGRKVAILFDEGSDKTSIERLRERSKRPAAESR